MIFVEHVHHILGLSKPHAHFRTKTSEALLSLSLKMQSRASTSTICQSLRRRRHTHTEQNEQFEGASRKIKHNSTPMTGFATWDSCTQILKRRASSMLHAPKVASAARAWPATMQLVSFPVHFALAVPRDIKSGNLIS